MCTPEYGGLGRGGTVSCRFPDALTIQGRRLFFHVQFCALVLGNLQVMYPPSADDQMGMCSARFLADDAIALHCSLRQVLGRTRYWPRLKILLRHQPPSDLGKYPRIRRNMKPTESRKRCADLCPGLSNSEPVGIVRIGKDMFRLMSVHSCFIHTFSIILRRIPVSWSDFSNSLCFSKLHAKYLVQIASDQCADPWRSATIRSNPNARKSVEFLVCSAVEPLLTAASSAACDSSYKLMVSFLRPCQQPIA
jgi:hypothetical protein